MAKNTYCTCCLLPTCPVNLSLPSCTCNLFSSSYYNVTQFYVLPTGCVHELDMFRRTDGEDCRIQHRNREWVSLLCGASSIFAHNL